MLPSKSTQAIESQDSRVNSHGDRNPRSRNAKGNAGKKPRQAIRRAAAPASSVDSRLEKVARIAFRLGGED
jgi:hypothetical protein